MREILNLLLQLFHLISKELIMISYGKDFSFLNQTLIVNSFHGRLQGILIVEESWIRGGQTW